MGELADFLEWYRGQPTFLPCPGTGQSRRVKGGKKHYRCCPLGTFGHVLDAAGDEIPVRELVLVFRLPDDRRRLVQAMITGTRVRAHGD